MVSPSLPQIGTKIALAKIYAVAIQAAEDTEILKLLIIFGRARLTIVWSSRPRKVPMITVKRIHHFREDFSAVCSVGTVVSGIRESDKSEKSDKSEFRFSDFPIFPENLNYLVKIVNLADMPFLSSGYWLWLKRTFMLNCMVWRVSEMLNTTSDVLELGLTSSTTPWYCFPPNASTVKLASCPTWILSRPLFSSMVPMTRS